MGLKNILSEKTKLIMVGGKGGVGKTTCASAIAVKIASEGKKVLVISSDPAPSLSDIFETSIGSKETKIVDEAANCRQPAGSKGEQGTKAPAASPAKRVTAAPLIELYGLEISSDVVLEKWKERFGAEIYEVISSFADVDYNFIDYIGTAPGIEEEYMLSFIIDLVEGNRYDVVVWDTAPAGHTLRLLQLPHLFLKHLEAATKFYMNMYSYIEKIKDMARQKSSKKTLLEIIGSWEALSEKIVRFIRDGSTTSYVIVTIPEALGVKLTNRVIEEFRENMLMVENIVINHAVKDEDCEFHRIRKNMQQRYIDFIKDKYNDINIVTLYLSPYEVKGIRRITDVAEELFT